MQSCSVQHCVLFLLTLYTLTTDPGSAAVFPIYAKLHQSVTLPCGAQCSGWAKWSLHSNRDVVFARCDQTSCTSVKDGYEMSYDQFKSGDLSLTITKPDYSMRKLYTCECEYSDYAIVNLKIFTVSSAVPVQTEGDLKLHVSVPEPVEVIYRGSVLADGVQICTVTNRTLQCNTEYTPRTSLSYPELTLRDMQRSESGTYTIRNLDYKEDIHVYAVSVSGLTPGDTTWIVIGVLILLALLIAGLVYYMRRKAEREKEEAERKRREVKSDKKAVKEDIYQALHRPTVEMMEELQRVEEKIKDLELKYRWDRVHSGDVTSFCNRKRSDLSLYREMFRPQVGDVKPVTGEVKSDMVAVYKDINEALHSPTVEEAELQQVEEKINDLELQYRDDRVHSGGVTLFCNCKREELSLYRKMFITTNTSLQTVTQQVKTVINAVNELIKEAVSSPKGEQEAVMQEVLQKINDVKLKYSRTEQYYRNVHQFFDTKRAELDCCRYFYSPQRKTTDLQRKEVEKEMDAVDDLIKEVLQEKKELEDVKEKIYDLEQKYPDLRDYCNKKRKELELCSKIYRTQKGPQQPGTGEVMEDMEAVYKIIRQYKHRPAVEVKKKIDDLDKKCSENIDYYSRVRMFWDQKRRDMELCSKLGLIELGFIWSTTEKEMEEVVKILNELKRIADQNHTINPVMVSCMYTRVSLSLNWINDRHREQRDDLNKFKQQLSPGLRDDRIIHDVETHLRGLEQWCIDKEYELGMYREKLEQRGGGGESTDVDLQTPRSKGGEGTPLLKVTTEQK